MACRNEGREGERERELVGGRLESQVARHGRVGGRVCAGMSKDSKQWNARFYDSIETNLSGNSQRARLGELDTLTITLYGHDKRWQRRRWSRSAFVVVFVAVFMQHPHSHAHRDAVAVAVAAAVALTVALSIFPCSRKSSNGSVCMWHTKLTQFQFAYRPPALPPAASPCVELMQNSCCQPFRMAWPWVAFWPGANLCVLHNIRVTRVTHHSTSLSFWYWAHALHMCAKHDATLTMTVHATELRNCFLALMFMKLFLAQENENSFE